MAITMGAGETVVNQVTAAHKLACIGMLEARRALLLLRGGETPGRQPARPGLGNRRALGIPITCSLGVPRPLGPGAGARCTASVQEALTNVAKHAGRGAGVTVRLVWAPDGVEVSVADRGGDGVDCRPAVERLRPDQHGRAGRAERRPAARRAGG